MKKLVLISFCSILFSNIISAQIDSLENASDFVSEDSVYTVADEMPEYPGGQAEMMKFIAQNIVYPKFEKENDIEGLSIIQFIIEKDGSVSNIKIAPGAEDKATSAMHNEVMRVIKQMPNWKPGRNEGKLVRVKYTVPIRFKLTGKSGKRKKKRK